MDPKVFNRGTLEEYTKKAKEQWGSTPEYQEYEERRKGRSEGEDKQLADRLMELFKEAGEIRHSDPASSEAQDLVKRIRRFITENMYTCSDDVLKGLGKMYSCGGEFTKNIDAMGGEGTGEFVDRAIQIYCKSSNVF